ERVLLVEHIPYVVQFSPPPLDLVDDIAYRERAHDHGQDISKPFRHAFSPAYRSLTHFARLMMQDNLDRSHQPLATKVGADVRFEIRRAAMCRQEAGECLQPLE